MSAIITVRSCENVRAEYLGEARLPTQKCASSVTLRHIVAVFGYSLPATSHLACRKNLHNENNC
ncbi:MAG: hypothetical protein DDT30_01649 [Dehalococcoidia bacterium]|nr:hypothetical protein [Bacillota bacterium]MBT9143235.1 hypothetical protein [Bacillota bacterium]